LALADAAGWCEGESESALADAAGWCEATDSNGNNTIIGVHAMSCHGLSTDWLAGIVAVPPSLVGCEYRLPPAGIVAYITIEFFSASFPPPVPPPRIVTA
jgi:hypothetical protein